MKTSKVFFKNSSNIRICGILDETNKNSKQIVIILHGYSTNKDRSSATQIATELSIRNVNSLRIDFNGCGESEGDFKYQTITSTINDVEAAIDYVKSIGYEQIELFGTSAGGLTAMAVTLEHPKITRLGLKCPVSDYVSQKVRRKGQDGIDLWKQQGSTLYTDAHGQKHEIDYSVFEDYKNHIMFDKVRNIKCPVLIVHGDADETVNVEDSKRVANNFPNCKLVIVPGADHRFTDEAKSRYVNNLFGEWFQNSKVMES